MLGTDRGMAPLMRAPRIVPKRRHISGRDPDLVFWIDTAGHPYYRVLLATRPDLFDPANAARRTPATFFDSTEVTNGSLFTATGGEGQYAVPREALLRLLPTAAVSYALIAYDDPSGAGGELSTPIAELARGAPSVEIGLGLDGAGLDRMFGIPLERLKTVVPSAASHVMATPFSLWGPAPAPVAAATGDTWDSDADAYAAAAQADDEHYDGAFDAGDGPVGAPALEPNEADYAQGYSDGFEDDYGAAGLGGSDEEETGEDLSLGLATMETPDEAETYALDEEEEPGEDRGLDAYGEDGSALAEAAEEESGEDVETPAVRVRLQPDDHAAALSDYGDESDAATPAVDALDDYDDGFDTPLSANGLTAAGPPAMLPDTEEENATTAAGAGPDETETNVDIAEAYADGAAEAPTPQAAPLDIPSRLAILEAIAPHESGAEGFARVNGDGEFEGRFGTAHPAYRRFHLGLTFGAFPFVQESGTLGRLLLGMRRRDAAEFERFFAPHGAALIEICNATGPHAWERPDGLSERLRPVGGAPLWSPAWTERFKAAGRHVPFQAAQNELASELFIEPMLPFCRALGLMTPRGLLLAVDRAVQMGAVDAKRWIAEAVNPLPTTAQRLQALSRLGYPDLQGFQRARHLPPTGERDPDTIAALVQALRESGRSPVPIPEAQQMIDTLLRQSAGTPWEARMRRLAARPAADATYA